MQRVAIMTPESGHRDADTSGEEQEGVANVLERGLAVVRNQGFLSLLMQLAWFFSDRFMGGLRLRFVLPKFGELSTRAVDLDEAIEFAYSFSMLGIRMTPMQNREEISRFLRFVAKREPKVIVEIGTSVGGTFFLLSRVASNDAVLVSVDLPPGLLSLGYPEWKENLYRSFAVKRQTVHLVRGNSHDLATTSAVYRLLEGRRIDVLFIDGDHSYDGAKRDFEVYSSLVSDSGVVALHDIFPNHRNKSIEVHRLWSELKSKYVTEEISTSTGDEECGIGIVFLSGSDTCAQELMDAQKGDTHSSFPL